jgi:imidazole glycerol-phosphate synthase subunit HisH
VITVVDSGIANIGSVLAACERIGAATHVTSDPAKVRSATALILPGVGAFADGMANLRRHGLVEPIREASARGIPILGICLGMQLLAEVGEEFGEHEGLGLIAGRVVKLQPGETDARVPNIGWCDVTIEKQSRLFAGVADRSAFYFVHSYYLSCTDPVDCVASIAFGAGPVAIAVERGNVQGVQFHPEKSQDGGLQLLDNFARLSAGRLT